MHVADPTVFVLLRQEVDRSIGDRDLWLTLSAQGLILWALQGTDPDQNLKMSATDVLQRIVSVIPSASTVLDAGYLQSQMEAMANKSGDVGRVIKWHRLENRFVLPYATRQSLAMENLADENLLSHIKSRLEERAQELDPALVKGLSVGIIASVSLKALQMSIRAQGSGVRCVRLGGWESGVPTHCRLN